MFSYNFFSLNKNISLITGKCFILYFLILVEACRSSNFAIPKENEKEKPLNLSCPYNPNLAARKAAALKKFRFTVDQYVMMENSEGEQNQLAQENEINEFYNKQFAVTCKLNVLSEKYNELKTTDVDSFFEEARKIFNGFDSDKSSRDFMDLAKFIEDSEDNSEDEDIKNLLIKLNELDKNFSLFEAFFK